MSSAAVSPRESENPNKTAPLVSAEVDQDTVKPESVMFEMRTSLGVVWGLALRLNNCLWPTKTIPAARLITKRSSPSIVGIFSSLIMGFVRKEIPPLPRLYLVLERVFFVRYLSVLPRR